MAMVDLEVAGRRYSVACRNGEEAHLQEMAAIVDGKAQDAAEALGGLSEARQLFYASLLLADELQELRAGRTPAAPAAEKVDEAAAGAIERLAERVEKLAVRLESGASAS